MGPNQGQRIGDPMPIQEGEWKAGEKPEREVPALEVLWLQCQWQQKTIELLIETIQKRDEYRSA